MNDQVLSIEQMRHLVDLGLDVSDASMYWIRVLRRRNGEDTIMSDWNVDILPERKFVDRELWTEAFYTFTLQDILEILPYSVKEDFVLYINRGRDSWMVGYADVYSDAVYDNFTRDNLIDAAYEMLCWCIKNGYVKTNKDKSLEELLDNTAVSCKTEEEAKECVRIFFNLGIRWLDDRSIATYWNFLGKETCYAKRKHIKELSYGLASQFVAHFNRGYQVIPFKQFKELIKQKTL